MNTIRFFLFSFIIFSLFLVTYILEHSPNQSVLPSRSVSIDKEFSEFLPEGSVIVSASETSVFYTLGMSVEEAVLWYKEIHKQSEVVSAQGVLPVVISVPGQGKDSGDLLIKLDQSKSTGDTVGTIMIQSS